MTANRRKLWATVVGVPAPPYRRHESRVQAYGYVENDRRNWLCGALRSPTVYVYVDERDGHGFRLHEKVDFSAEAAD